MNTYPASRRSPPPPPPTHPSDTTDEGVAGRIGPSADAYDALADMFLGELGGQGQAAHAAAPTHANGALQRRDAAPAAAERAGVELLILGHLPIMASAWASHYVRHAAGRLTGPVASLRLADGAAWLELMNAPATTAAAAPTLNAALRAASSAEHWVIRADAGREREFIGHQRLTRITLLTGCNEAATVDAYRAVKQLAAEAEHLPALRVAVLGGTAAACRQAADRICDACHAFLEIEIEAVTCPGAIGTGPAGTELYHGPVEGDARLILDRLGVIHRAEAATEAMAATVEAAPAEIPVTGDAIPAQETPVPAEAVIAAAVPRAEDLGLRPLAATCPYEPSVQLATDETGGLHLLIQAKEAGQLDAAVRALSIVAAWASDHRMLLGLPDASGEARPMQRHLLTAAPREARRLLDTDIRIHLCASADRAQHGWVLADLN